MAEELKIKIKSICLSQAKSLLMEFGEFFPFAFGITSNNKIIPVMTYAEEEHPSSIDVITDLEEALKKSDEDNHFECVAICVDVLRIPPYLIKKIDSLEIRIDCKNNKGVNYYIPYKRDKKNQFIFLEEYESEGTFIFYNSFE